MPPVYTAQTPKDSTAVMGRRFGAFLIDMFLGFLVFGIAFLALSEKAPGLGLFVTCKEIRDAGGSSLCLKTGNTIRYAEGGRAVGIFAIAVAFSFLNFVVLQASSGSLGKRAVGLAVVRRESGAALGSGKAIIRWLVSIVDFGCCFLVGLIMALTTKGHRRLGDMAAGSVVVDKSQLGTAPSIPGSAPSIAPGGWPAPPAPGGFGAPPPPGGWAPPAPPANPWSQPAAPAAPAANPWSQPAAPAAPVAPAANPWNQPAAPAAMAPEPAVPAALAPEPGPEPTNPAPAAATAGPQWDAARNAYIQWEPVSGQWMQFDDAAQEWRPIT